MRSTPARPFVTADDDEDRFLPEGPRAVTVGGRDAVAWVNIQTAADATRGAVHLRFWDDGELAVHNLPSRPGFIAPTDRPGVLLVGMGKEVGTLDLETNEFVPLAAIPDDSPRTIINDGDVVPGGKAVVFGTKDTKFEGPIAHLYLFTVDDAKISVLRDGQVCSNGKVFARDAKGLVLFDIDTPTKTVARYRLDVAARAATPDGVAIDLKGEAAFPDGMRDGGNGTAIVAFYDPAIKPAGRAVRYDLATGAAVEEWTTPGAPRVTCPLLLKRPDGVKLVLTTATEGMPAADFAACPASGDLFIADTDMEACPVQEVVRFG